jgi:hypothetical protein
MLMKGSSKRKRTKAELEEVKQEGGGPARRHPGLPHGREAPQAGARRDAGLPAERAEPAPGAAADGQPARERRADDAVQHLIEANVSEIGATSL